MTTQHILAAVFAVVMLGWQFWPWLSALAGKLKLPTIGAAKPATVDADLSDLAALKQVQARFVRLGCKEGQAACQVLYAHFFHEEGHA